MNNHFSHETANFYWNHANQINAAVPYQQPPTTNYPVAALTGFLGDMFHAICCTGIDPPVVGAVFKSTASALTKKIADIEWPNGAVTNIGANEAVIAGTCSGKSHVLKIAQSPINAYLGEEAQADLADSNFCFVENTNSTELLQELSNNKSVFLSSDEGSALIPLFRKNGATLIKGLDGETLRYARVSTGRIEVQAPSLTALIELQPEIFHANKHTFGVGAGSAAIINRFQVGLSKIQANTSQMHRHRIPDQTLIKYELRVEELLAMLEKQRQTSKPRQVLRLSPQAREYLIWTGDEIKVSMSLGRLGHDISLYTGRHAERVLKQAGVLHAFEHGTEGEVELTTIQASDALARWSCISFHELTYVPPTRSQLDTDVMALEQSLLSAAYQTGRNEFKYSEIRRYSPNIGLTTQRFTRAFANLAGTGRVQLRRIGRTDWVQVIPYPYWNNTGSPRLID